MIDLRLFNLVLVTEFQSKLFNFFLPHFHQMYNVWEPCSHMSHHSETISDCLWSIRRSPKLSRPSPSIQHIGFMVPSLYKSTFNDSHVVEVNSLVINISWFKKKRIMIASPINLITLLNKFAPWEHPHVSEHCYTYIVRHIWQSDSK